MADPNEAPRDVIGNRIRALIFGTPEVPTPGSLRPDPNASRRPRPPTAAEMLLPQGPGDYTPPASPLQVGPMAGDPLFGGLYTPPAPPAPNLSVGGQVFPPPNTGPLRSLGPAVDAPIDFVRGAVAGSEDSPYAQLGVLAAAWPGSPRTLVSGGRGLYSRIDDLLAKLPAKGVHPNKLASMLKSGASAEEAAFRKLPEFIASKGNQLITPQELRVHLQKFPAPRVETKTLGVPRTTPPDPTRPFDDIHYPHAETSGPTKYGSYTLPGGEHYRESLYTLAQPENEELAQLLLRRDDLHHAINLTNRPVHELNLPTDPNQIQPWVDARLAEVQRYKDEYQAVSRRIAELQAATARTPYHSGHFDQPDILAHVRTKERTLPTGERGRFLEEVQSDWHQRGKQEGYQRSLPPLTREDVQMNRVGGSEWGSPYWESFDRRTGQLITRHPGDFSENEAIGEAVRFGAREQPGVPDAPFKESWPDLALKQQLLDVAQSPDLDWLGFTSGKTQAERYDLSKQVSRIGFEPAAADDYSLGQLVAYDKEGNEVVRHRDIEPSQLADYIGKEPAAALQREIAAKQFDAQQWSIEQDPQDNLWYVVDPNGDYVSDGSSSRRAADDARRYMLNQDMWNDRPAEISGLALQLGGEGMRHFYDQVLPRRLQKILSPFGGSVEPGAVPVTKTRTIEVPGYTFIDAEGNSRGAFYTRFAAEEYLRTAPAWLKKEGGYIKEIPLAKEIDEAVDEPAWFARLTPEMKQRILKEGLPLMMLPLLIGAGLADEDQVGTPPPVAPPR